MSHVYLGDSIIDLFDSYNIKLKGIGLYIVDQDLLFIPTLSNIRELF